MAFTLRPRPGVFANALREGITETELQEIMSELSTIARTLKPSVHGDIVDIDVTGGKWQRVKHEGHTWRAVIEIIHKHEVINLEMIVRRSPDTYSRVKYQWRELNRELKSA